MNRPLITLAAIALAGTAAAQTGHTASATFVNADGQSSGAATLTQTPVGVLIELEVGGLPAESWVAFHVHETGECDAGDDHETAGDHFNPTEADHGFLVETGAHAGDMPNQYVPADGILRARVLNAAVTLKEGDEAGIRGRSLMIHADPDDNLSQPSGDAGDRIACAPIE